MKILRAAFRRAILLLILAFGLGVCPLAVIGQDQNLIPATAAFDPPGCSDFDLAGVDIGVGDLSIHVDSPLRTDPEWKAIILDSNRPPHLQPPKVLEGFVAPTPSNETSTSQATAEVAEEDIAWTHYTHDWTFKVVPDSPYQHLLSSWVRFPGEFQPPSGATPDQNGCPPGFGFVPDPNNPDPFAGSCIGCPPGGGFLTDNGCQLRAPEICPDGSMGLTCQHTDMEIEWDSASLMGEKEGFQRIWGAVPEFAWPAVGDRAWVAGRWIFDCGHPGDFAFSKGNVKWASEIHPPRALVAFRLNHPALDSFPVPRVSAPNFPYPQSWLPVTGEPVPGAAGPTNVAVTEADILVSGNGGAASDICTIVSAPCSGYGGHTGPIIPVNDQNYVFDIYPPGTNYSKTTSNGNFVITPPVPDASLQWRVVDHFSELPAHACGDNEVNTFLQFLSVCKTVDPIFCLIDDSTPPAPQDQSNIGTGCPVPQPPVVFSGQATRLLGPGTGLPCISPICSPPAHPTRLRVILPFQGTNANFFAQSILLGWDDVPTGPPQINPGVSANLANGAGISPCDIHPCGTPLVRTFKVRLHKLTRLNFGDNSDWRIFLNVGGQWRYISRVFDTDSGGSNPCHVFNAVTDAILGVDCFQFDATPWTVTVQDGTSIHVGVGGFLANGLEDNGSSLFLCRTYHDSPAGCDPPTDFSVFDDHFRALAFENDERIGTYEFDLVGPGYSPPAAFTTQAFDCPNHLIGSCQIQYEVEFSVAEVQGPAAPPSPLFRIGDPNFTGAAGTFISATTPIILASGDSNTEGFQYRFHGQGAFLPTYPSPPDFPGPVHWAHVDLPVLPIGFLPSSAVFVDGANSGDGPYDFQYSAESFGNVLQPRQGTTVILDTTPPVATIVQPAATQYPRSGMLTLSYTVSDGSGSGVHSFTPKMDGATTLPDGTGLASGQTISLNKLSLGTHTFSVDSVDNVNNAGTKSVTFSIVQTADDVSNSINIVRGGYVLNLITVRYAQNVTLTNTTAATITGPISLVLDNLSSNAQLDNATGMTDSLVPPAASPYLNTFVNLGAGQSVSLTLQFSDPTRTTISYTTRALAGPGAR
jgi:hypothetical protein